MSQGRQSLVIFDCDGVLVDSEIISVEVDRRVLADLGWVISREEIIDRFVGRSHAHFLEVVEEHLGRKLPDAWEDAYQHLYRQELAQNLKLIDGIAEALKAIDYPMCVASNGSHSKTEFTLKRTGLWSRFEGRIFSASDVTHGKPAPDLFLHAASVLGFESSRCVVCDVSRHRSVISRDILQKANPRAVFILLIVFGFLAHPFCLPSNCARFQFHILLIPRP